MNMNANKWTTFYGTTMEISKLSHSHLSNILYFYKLVSNSDEPRQIRKELELRFGGIQLPYYPMISFTQEINELIRKEYTHGRAGDPIIVDGRWIGEIKYT